MSQEVQTNGTAQQQNPALQKSLARIQRAVEFCRRNNYAANNVFGIVASEGLNLRIRLIDELGEEESKEVLSELQSFVRYAATEGLTLQAVETFLYTRGAVFEVVDSAGDNVGVINLSELTNETASVNTAEQEQTAT